MRRKSFLKRGLSVILSAALMCGSISGEVFAKEDDSPVAGVSVGEEVPKIQMINRDVIPVQAAGDTFSLDGFTYAINNDNLSVTIIGHNDKTIASLNVPEKVSNDGRTYIVTRINYNVFRDYQNLEDVVFPSQLESIDYGAFNGCTRLNNVKIPKSIKDVSINVFNGCKSLKNFSFEEGITAIPKFLFSGCTSLESIEIPETVTKIEDFAFSGCTNLTTVNMPSKLESIGLSAFQGCDNLNVLCNYYSIGAVCSIDSGLSISSSGESFSDDPKKMIDRSNTSFYANTDAINANGTLPITVKWNAKNKWRRKLENQKLVVLIPRHTDLEEETVKVNGVAIADYYYDSNSRRLTIPVGSDSATATFSVSLREKEKITSYAYVSANKEGEYQEEVIGVINEDFSGISISLPETTNKKDIEISGITTPSTRVEVFVDGRSKGTTNALKTGSYSKKISIDNPQDGFSYTVEVRGIDKNGNVISAVEEVTYEESAPSLSSFVLNYKEGSADKRVDLINTKGTKPLVYYSPGCEFVFTAGFENKDKIDKVYVTSTKGGEKKSLEATYDSRTDKYVTNGYFDADNTGYVPGVIGIEYTKKGEIPKATTNYNFTEAQSLLNEKIKTAPITYSKKTDEEVVASIDLSGVFKGVNDAVLDTAIKYADLKAGTSMSDVFDDLGFSKDVISFVVPGVDDSKYILSAEKKDFGYLLMMVKDGAKAGDKIASFRLEMTDSTASEFNKIFDSAEKWGYISKGIGVAYNAYNIYKDYNTLVEEINQSSTIENKTEAKKKALDLRNDQMTFMLLTAAIPLFIAVGPSVMPAASLLLSGMLSTMTATSELFYAMRVANIKGEKFRLNWVIDPSGYVYDASNNKRIENATVTAYWIPYDGTAGFWNNKPSTSNYGTKWDAAEYEQENSLNTNIDGKYAWNVPEGWWRVKCEKTGYETVWTDWMTVPPVQTEVNIGMKKPAGTKPTPTPTPTKRATVKKAPAAKTGLYYTGKDQALITVGTASDGRMEYALSNTFTAPKTGWSSTIPKAKKEGTYTVWYRATGNGSATASKSIKVTIDALKITLKKTSSNYNKKVQKITVKSVSYGGKTMRLKAKDYKLTYSPGTVKNAGKYTVTLTVKKGEHTGKTGTSTYTIKQIANPLTAKAKKKTLPVKSSAIKSKVKTLKIKDVAKISKAEGRLSYDFTGSSPKLQYNKANGSITVPKGLAPGRYPVKIKVNANGNTNYKAGSKNISFIIQVKK